MTYNAHISPGPLVLVFLHVYSLIESLPPAICLCLSNFPHTIIASVLHSHLRADIFIALVLMLLMRSLDLRFMLIY